MTLAAQIMILTQAVPLASPPSSDYDRTQLAHRLLPPGRGMCSARAG